MSETIRFSGKASLRQGLSGPLSCELRGVAADGLALPLLLRFAPRAQGALPALLHDAELRVSAPASRAEAAESADCELRAANLPQPLLLSQAMLHRDAEALAETVIAPRAVRWRTRLFWQAVFLLMRTAYGRSLLLRRYQK